MDRYYELVDRMNGTINWVNCWLPSDLWSLRGELSLGEGYAALPPAMREKVAPEFEARKRFLLERIEFLVIGSREDCVIAGIVALATVGVVRAFRRGYGKALCLIVAVGVPASFVLLFFLSSL
jgi:hypothetical protein